MGYQVTNKRTGLSISTAILPKQIKPSLLIEDGIGMQKVATFQDEDAAKDFIDHLARMFEIGKETEKC